MDELSIEDIDDLGSSVRIEAAEWSVECLTCDWDFIHKRLMKPITIFAAHVWTGAQYSSLVNNLSVEGKLKSEIFRLVIHSVHELAESLSCISVYHMIDNINSENDDTLTGSIEIPLVTGGVMDLEYTSSLIDWINNSLCASFNKKVSSSHYSDIKNYCATLCTNIATQWLIHYLLSNYIYGKEGPLNLIEIKKAIDLLLPLNFSSINDKRQARRSDVINMSKTMRKIYMSYNRNGNEQEGRRLSVDERNELVDAIRILTTLYPLSELQDSLLEFVRSINKVIPPTKSWMNKLSTRVDNETKSSDNTKCQKIDSPTCLQVDESDPFNKLFKYVNNETALLALNEHNSDLIIKERYDIQNIAAAKELLKLSSNLKSETEENKENDFHSHLYTQKINPEGRVVSFSDSISSESDVSFDNKNQATQNNPKVIKNKKSRRSYNRWTKEETYKLIEGVNNLDVGHWHEIMLLMKIDRDEVALKDRWRNLVDRGHLINDKKTGKYYLKK